jgi:hypothetical protein
MVTVVASSSVCYQIPDEWWRFCELDKWKPTTDFYLARELNDDDVTLVALSDIEPTVRDLGEGSPFRKYKLVPIMLRFQSPESWLPPIDIGLLSGSRYKYKLTNGFHRFVASMVVGYKSIPARIGPSD